MSKDSAADDSEYLFSRAHLDPGGVNGPLTVSLHDSLPKSSKLYFELINDARKGSLMVCLDATDYHGYEWVGGVRSVQSSKDQVQPAIT